ncbi:MAG: hypothetical protein ACFFER_09195 [Candidatus Thorarchaeota archaeon]
MTGLEVCKWLADSKTGNMCRLRNVSLPRGEVAAKCTKSDLAVICVDAYSALSKGLESLKVGSTDSFLWLIESANQFENLGETDNAITAMVKSIDFATKMNLIDKGYETFRYARSMMENGLNRKDPSLSSPMLKQTLMKSGRKLIEAARKIAAGSPVADMQAELKASILGGVGLKKTEEVLKAEEKDRLVISHGRSLYEKKASEYKEGADTYMASGMTQNAITFSCLGALADLMLGKPKDGLLYLTKFTDESGIKEEFNNHPCFQWTRLVFKGLISRDQDALLEANKIFLNIPWSFKDDHEFARRAMESVERRITQ